MPVAEGDNSHVYKALSQGGLRSYTCVIGVRWEIAIVEGAQKVGGKIVIRAREEAHTLEIKPYRHASFALLRTINITILTIGKAGLARHSTILLFHFVVRKCTLRASLTTLATLNPCVIVDNLEIIKERSIRWASIIAALSLIQELFHRVCT